MDGLSLLERARKAGLAVWADGDQKDFQLAHRGMLERIRLLRQVRLFGSPEDQGKGLPPLGIGRAGAQLNGGDQLELEG